MSTYAIRRRGLQAEIQDIVKRYIIDHRFKPGDPLPGEGELARQMGISRPSLREAMKVLQTVGVIETRHGSGTYVGSLSLDPFVDGMIFQILIAGYQGETAPRNLVQLIGIREAIETSTLSQAAGLYTDADIQHLYALCDKMAAEPDASTAFGQHELAFHLALCQPLPGRLYDEFIRAFWKISTFSIRPHIETSGHGIMAEHRAIVDALAAQDTGAAVTHMRAHIRNLARAAETAFDTDALRADALNDINDEKET